MKIVSLVSQKGGVGKTTIAMNLAVLAEKRGYTTVVFDLDPQASITKWKDKRGAETPPDVVPAQQGRLKTLLALAQKQGAQLIIIDTAGSADSAALAAAEVADLILVPARPNGLDLEAVETTVRVAMRHAKRPFYVVLTQTPSQTSIAEEATEVIEGAGVLVCPVRLGLRLDYRHPTPDGKAAVEWRPKGVAAREVVHLWTWMCQQIGIAEHCETNTTA